MNPKNILKKLTILYLTLSLFAVVPAFSQKRNYKEIRIGDTIPPLVLNKFLGNGAKVVDLRKQAGKGLLIINFWATWCVPCIRELPVIDSIKAKHPNEVTILSVAYEDSAVVKRFFKKNTEYRWPHLEIATNDNDLRFYFPHRGIPHNIWIDRAGIVRSITGGDDINIENVEKFINGDNLKMEVKKDNMTFNYYKPFHLADSIYTYRSILSPYISGIGGGLVPWGANGKGLSRYLAFNICMLDIFFDAYSQHTLFYNTDYKRIKVITKDSLKFFRPKQIHNPVLKAKYKTLTDWDKDHGFCYELSLPQLTPDSLFYSYVIADMERYFKVKYRLEKKKMLCNVVRIKKGSPYHLAEFRSTQDSLNYQEIYKGKIILRNVTFKEFMVKTLSVLEDQDDPWVDETKITFPLDLTIQLDKDKESSVKDITSKLADYGVEVKKEYRDYPIMVLEDMETH